MEENEITSPFVEDATTPDTGSTQPTAPAPKRKNWFRRHTKLCVAVVILAVVAAVVGSQLRKSKAAAGASADYQYVRTTTLKTTSLNDSVTVNGTVKSGDEASVTVADSAKTYKVATVNVEVGDTVQEGDVIATLDTTDLEKQIENAEQSYNDTLQQAQTSYDRAVDEYNTAVVQHENNLIDLQAKIDDADKNLSDAQDALETAKSSRDSAQSAYDSACSSYDTIKAAYDNAAASISTFTDAVNAAANTQNDAISRVNSAIAAYNADPSEANQAAMNEANDALSAAQAAYQQAQNDLANAQNSCSVTELGLYGFTAIQQSLNSAEQTKTSAQNALTSAQNAVETAQNQIETCESQQKSAHDSYDQEKNYSTIKAKAQSVEDAKTKLEQAKRTPDTLTTLKDTLANCTLTATMSGTITALDATVGSICTGTVATIQNTDALVVEVTIPSNDVPGLTTGMSCNITSDATGDDVIAGTLTQIDPVANDSGTFGAKVRVNGDADDLLIGIQAKVEIVKNATDGVFTVPIDAVGTKEDGTQYVLRKTGGEGTDMTFEEVTVTTGDANDYYTVISGDDLKEGDVIRFSADLAQGIVTGSSDDSADFFFTAGGDEPIGGADAPAGGPGGDVGGGPAGGPGGN